MQPPKQSLLQRATALARDHDSGAAELTADLLSLLSEALEAGGTTPLDVARIVLAGQPAMAPLWHACAAAVCDADAPGTFARARAEMMRAPAALVRAASRALCDLLAGDRAPLVLTLSYSSSVARVLGEVARHAPLRIACAEGRPRFEGRRLATELVSSVVDVTVVVDAALTALLDEASVVVMGADAVAAHHWINKVGSFGIAAAASLRGVPVYVVAARDKFVPGNLSSRLEPPAADPDEVWNDRPASLHARNVYFETVPAELATLFLSDRGPLTSSDLPMAVERRSQEVAVLLSQMP